MSRIKGDVEPEGLATRWNAFLRLVPQMQQQFVGVGARPQQPRTESRDSGDDLSDLMIIGA